MSQSTGVWRMRPPLRSTSQAHAPSAMSARTRVTASLTSSTELKSRRVARPGTVKSLITTGTRNTMASRTHQAIRRATLTLATRSGVGAWLLSISAKPRPYLDPRPVSTTRKVSVMIWRSMAGV